MNANEAAVSDFYYVMGKINGLIDRKEVREKLTEQGISEEALRTLEQVSLEVYAVALKGRMNKES